MWVTGQAISKTITCNEEGRKVTLQRALSNVKKEREQSSAASRRYDVYTLWERSCR